MIKREENKMKKFISILMIALLAGSFLCVVPAFADPALPQQIATYFSSGDFKDYTILDYAELQGYGSDDCAFVLVRSGKNQNILYQFKQKDGVWKRQFVSWYGTPQTVRDVRLSVSDAGYEWPSDTPVTRPQLSVMQMNEENEYCELCVTYQLENGKWLLHRIWSYTGWQSMLIKEGAISFYENIESTRVTETVRGSFQRDIRYINLNSFPKTLKDAKAKITAEPELPASNELISQNVKFIGGQSFNVYSAPDVSSLRGANGKAKVSTNGWIQVFGRDNGYVLIQYSIDSKHYRFGYIDESSLPKNSGVNDLYFNPMPAWTAGKVSVTDDPLYSHSTLVTLPDASPVTWLATLGDWAYIESSSGDYLRGFVPLGSLTTGRTFSLQYLPDQNDLPVWYGELTVYPDGSFEYFAVPAQEGSLGNAVVSTLSVFDTVTEEQVACAAADEDGIFRGSGVLRPGATGLCFIAFDPAGNAIGTRMAAQW